MHEKMHRHREAFEGLACLAKSRGDLIRID